MPATAPTLLGEITRGSDSYVQPAKELSPLDARIVDALQDNGRIRYADIARDLEVSEKQIRARVDELRAERIIDITVVGDPHALGYTQGAMIALSVEVGRMTPAMIAELGAIPAVAHVALTTGRYQALAECFLASGTDLVEILEAVSQVAGGDCRAEVFPYVSVPYQQVQWQRTYSKRDENGGVGIGSPVLKVAPADESIIAALSDDGRRSFRTIAADLGISEGQVRQRFRRLSEAGAVRVQAIVHPGTLGYGTVAWVAIRCAAGVHMDDLAKQLAKVSGITYVIICLGRFQALVEVIAVDVGSLQGILENEISGLPGIVSVEAFVYLALHYKRVLPASRLAT